MKEQRKTNREKVPKIENIQRQHCGRCETHLEIEKDTHTRTQTHTHTHTHMTLAHVICICVREMIRQT